MKYIFPVMEHTKIPGFKTTEPALQELFKAKYLREEREKSFKNDHDKRAKIDEYLDSIEEELKIRSKAFRYHIFEIGKLLCELKIILPHGSFQKWVDNNFDFSRESAYNFMKVYRACMGHPEVVEYFNPSCLYFLASPSFPAEFRQALFEGVKGKVDIKKKDLVKIAIQFKKGEVKTTDKQVQDLLKKQQHTSIRERYIIELRALIQLIADRLRKIEKIPNINSSNPLIENYAVAEVMSRHKEDDEITSMIRGFIVQTYNHIKELDDKCN